MSGAKHLGGPRLSDLSKRVLAVPVRVSLQVAERAAPAITGLAGAAYDGGRTVYGDARPASANGGPLDLHRTGATRGTVRFVNAGTIVRCVLGTSYARYLIRYGILPNGKALIPRAWAAEIKRIADRALSAQGARPVGAS